jgi:hypothetical protein
LTVTSFKRTTSRSTRTTRRSWTGLTASKRRETAQGGAKASPCFVPSPATKNVARGCAVRRIARGARGRRRARRAGGSPI